MLDEIICSECGKAFIPAAAHMYKRIKDRRTVYQCSYTCYRKAGGDSGKYRESRLKSQGVYKVRKKVKETTVN